MPHNRNCETKMNNGYDNASSDELLLNIVSDLSQKVHILKVLFETYRITVLILANIVKTADDFAENIINLCTEKKN